MSLLSSVIISIIVFSSILVRADLKSDQYWADIEKLCMEYTGGTANPPCSREQGAKVILEHIKLHCSKSKGCLREAVDICLRYSGATRPKCNISNGLIQTLDVIRSYEADHSKSQSVIVPVDDAIDIKKGERGSGR